ncbi:candidapepsin-4 precursor [Grosmannia clavigera kw1407]|uniref:Candidapepsin-4 n=1 Tax=Grosmannia clavigera (strain kw1407 / UAMH 11150) TaxID=655863 RepID=F0XCV8_GROCL|nr:candidapepsin-4 precursor [Grosmannia clavigera kw1407]EFX04447.1 candidapepsin-4 precursor [Grosmannia clavigera kw1407]
MICSRLLHLALSAVGGLASAMPKQPMVVARVSDGTSDMGNNTFLSIPMERVQLSSGQSLRRRDDVNTVVYPVSDAGYAIEIDVGTPTQRVPVLIDTGSDELWVNPDCSGLSDSVAKQACLVLGQYFPSDSTTADDPKDSSLLEYGKGSANVTYIVDSVSIPGAMRNLSMTDVTLGVATASKNLAIGILGVGFTSNVEYLTVLDKLDAQNEMQSRAFSLVLGASNATDEAPASDGTIIFNGVDTRKFTGPLQQLDNLSPQDGDDDRWRYFVELTNSTYAKKDKTNTTTTLYSSSLRVLLDSGSSYSYLPPSFIGALANTLNLTVSTTSSSTTINGTIAIDCKATVPTGMVDFAFGSALTISVPLADLIWVNGDVCMIGIEPIGDDKIAVLGDDFLRSAYVLFDQDNQKIYMAEAANCGTHAQLLVGTISGNITSYNYTGECNQSTADLQVSASASAAAVFPISLTTVLFAFACIQIMMAMM